MSYRPPVGLTCSERNRFGHDINIFRFTQFCCSRTSIIATRIDNTIGFREFRVGMRRYLSNEILRVDNVGIRKQIFNGPPTQNVNTSKQMYNDYAVCGELDPTNVSLISGRLFLRRFLNWPMF